MMTFYGKDNIRVIMVEKSMVYDVKDFKVSFPNIEKDKIVIIKGAGHWVHADKLKDTRNAITEFLKLQI